MGKIYLSQYTSYANAAGMLLRRNRQLTPRLYCCRFLPSLNMNQVAEKTISWSATVYSNKLSSQCNLTAQIEICVHGLKYKIHLHSL
jgi:hypothetical protein